MRAKRATLLLFPFSLTSVDQVMNETEKIKDGDPFVKDGDPYFARAWIRLIVLLVSFFIEIFVSLKRRLFSDNSDSCDPEC